MMEITAGQIEAFDRGRSRHERLRAQFGNFVDSCNFFGDPKCQVQGVVIVRESPVLLIANYSTVRVAFHFLVAQTADDTLRGKVVVTLDAPTFVHDRIVLGSFTFNGNGEVYDQPPGREDPVETGAHGPEIVLHFITAGLKHEQP